MSQGSAYPDKILGKWTGGINNVDDALKLSDKELIASQNCDLDDAGTAKRRKGPTVWKSGAYKWLSNDCSVQLAVRGVNLVRLLADKTEIILRSDLIASAPRMVYKQVLNRTYYTNNQVIGYVEDGVSHDLPVAADPFKRVMPPGEFLEYHNGRLYVGLGNLMIFSDVGKYDQYDERDNIKQFKGPLTLMSAVKNGMFIADGTTYFMDLVDPTELVPGALRKVAFYNAIPHTAVRVDGGLISYDKPVPGKVLVWGSEKGICIGTDSGDFMDVTIKRYQLPSGKHGAALYRENHRGTSQVVMTITE